MEMRPIFSKGITENFLNPFKNPLSKDSEPIQNNPSENFDP